MNNSEPTKFKGSTYVLKAVLFCIVFTGLFIVLSFTKSFIPEKFERLAHGVIGTTAALLTTFLFLFVEKKKFADIGLAFNKKTIAKFFFGVLIGTVLSGIMSLSVIYFSDFKLELNASSNLWRFILCTMFYIPLAFMEELGFRAYPLAMVNRGIGIRFGILLTSILFALYHIANGWTIQDSFLGAGVWGILFGLAAVYSKGIAMPTGIHFAANITTDAFGTTTDSYNIWVLKFNDGSAIVNYQSSPLTTIVPQIALLLVGIISMEYYLMTKKTAGIQ